MQTYAWRCMLYGLVQCGLVTAFCSLTTAEEVPVRGVLISPIEDVHVSGEESGLIKEVHVQVGERVVAGDLLVTLSDVDVRLALQRVQAEYAIICHAAENPLPVQLVEKTLAVAKAELDRAEDINVSRAGTITIAEIERLRLTYERAQLELEQARRDREGKQLEAATKRVELSIAERQLERRRILAPCAGVVTKLEHRAGEWLLTGAACCRLVDLSRVRAEGFLDPSQPFDLAGHQALLTLKGSTATEQFKGTVVFVDPEVSAINGQCRIWVELDNAEGKLRPGSAGSMVILYQPTEQND